MIFSYCSAGPNGRPARPGGQFAAARQTDRLAPHWSCTLGALWPLVWCGCVRAHHSVRPHSAASGLLCALANRLVLVPAYLASTQPALHLRHRPKSGPKSHTHTHKGPARMINRAASLRVWPEYEVASLSGQPKVSQHLPPPHLNLGTQSGPSASGTGPSVSSECPRDRPGGKGQIGEDSLRLACLRRARVTTADVLPVESRLFEWPIQME